MPRRWHRLLHWLAVRTRRGCPLCGQVIKPNDSWVVLHDEVYHVACGREISH